MRDLFSYLSASRYAGLRIPFDRSFDLEALDRLRAAASPTDKYRKDSTLPPVTSEKPRPLSG